MWLAKPPQLADIERSALGRGAWLAAEVKTSRARIAEGGARCGRVRAAARKVGAAAGGKGAASAIGASAIGASAAGSHAGNVAQRRQIMQDHA